MGMIDRKNRRWVWSHPYSPSWIKNRAVIRKSWLNHLLDSALDSFTDVCVGWLPNSFLILNDTLDLLLLSWLLWIKSHRGHWRSITSWVSTLASSKNDWRRYSIDSNSANLTWASAKYFSNSPHLSSIHLAPSVCRRIRESLLGAKQGPPRFKKGSWGFQYACGSSSDTTG